MAKTQSTTYLHDIKYKGGDNGRTGLTEAPAHWAGQPVIRHYPLLFGLNNKVHSSLVCNENACWI